MFSCNFSSCLCGGRFKESCEQFSERLCCGPLDTRPFGKEICGEFTYVACGGGQTVAGKPANLLRLQTGRIPPAERMRMATLVAEQ